jgi:hypothetical protein
VQRGQFQVGIAPPKRKLWLISKERKIETYWSKLSSALFPMVFKAGMKAHRHESGMRRSALSNA